MCIVSRRRVLCFQGMTPTDTSPKDQNSMLPRLVLHVEHHINPLSTPPPCCVRRELFVPFPRGVEFYMPAAETGAPSLNADSSVQPSRVWRGDEALQTRADPPELFQLKAAFHHPSCCLSRVVRVRAYIMSSPHLTDNRAPDSASSMKGTLCKAREMRR